MSCSPYETENPKGKIPMSAGARRAPLLLIVCIRSELSISSDEFSILTSFYYRRDKGGNGAGRLQGKDGTDAGRRRERSCAASTAASTRSASLVGEET
jgi:hypothetical protein